MHILKKSRQGFTLIELLLVLAITLILISVSTLSLTNVQQFAYLSKSIEILLSDIKLQQTKAMNSYTLSGTPTRYGIHFEETTYTLFEGDTYVADAATNFTVSLDGQLSFEEVLFPNSTIVFERGSGEIVGFVDGFNTVVLNNPGSSDNSTIELNRYGVFTEIN